MSVLERGSLRDRFAFLRRLVGRGKAGDENAQQAVSHGVEALGTKMDVLATQIARFDKDLARLAREQLKMNTWLEQKTAVIDDTLDEIRAAQVDYRRRENRTVQDIQRSAQEDVVDTLVPELIQFLDRIGEGAQAMTKASANQPELAAWARAMADLHRQGERLLEGFDICPIEALGRAFDPHIHRAVERIPRSDVPANTVVEEWTRGYRRDEQVLRFAEVVIAQPLAEAAQVNGEVATPTQEGTSVEQNHRY